MDIRELKDRVVDGGKRVFGKIKVVGEKVVNETKDGIRWAVENPEKAAAIAGTGAALIGGANKIIRSINRNVTLRQTEKEKRTRVYDHSLNAYVYTKKPLTKEQIEFIHRERRRTGKKVSEIMAEMDILRR